MDMENGIIRKNFSVCQTDTNVTHAMIRVYESYMLGQCSLSRYNNAINYLMKVGM
jgi:hypothetical protein